MNGPIPAGGEAMASSSHTLTLDALSKLTMVELRELHHAIRLIEDVLNGVINTPTYTREGNDLVLNAAGDVVDKIDMHLIACADLIIDAAKAATPTSAEEIEARAWLILSNEACFREDLATFVALAAEHSVAVSEAEAA